MKNRWFIVGFLCITSTIMGCSILNDNSKTKFPNVKGKYVGTWSSIGQEVGGSREIGFGWCKGWIAIDSQKGKKVSGSFFIPKRDDLLCELPLDLEGDIEGKLADEGIKESFGLNLKLTKNGDNILPELLMCDSITSSGSQKLEGYVSLGGVLFIEPEDGLFNLKCPDSQGGSFTAQVIVVNFDGGISD